MKKYTLIILSVLFLYSCKEDAPIEIPKVSEATLMYLIGDNSLKNYIKDDVIDLETFFPENNKANVFVYHDHKKGYSSNATLYLLERRTAIDANSTEITSPILKEYKTINSCDMATFDMVIEDIKRLYPGTVIKNLLMSSHALSWIPANGNIYHSSRQKAFGEDQSSGSAKIDIDELADGLEKHDLDVLMFDACYMNSVEIVYELRNSAKHIVASPAEILANGFPYHLLSPHFANGTLSAEYIAAEYGDYYKDNANGGTITHTNTSKLEELASTIKLLLAKYDYKSKASIIVPLLSTYIRTPYNVASSSPFADDLYSIFGELNLTPEDKTKLDKIWKEAFPAYYRTDNLIGLDLRKTNGVTFYSPSKTIPNLYNDYFVSLDWASASGFDQLLK